MDKLVDFSQPIEAYHTDGRVLPVSLRMSVRQPDKWGDYELLEPLVPEKRQGIFFKSTGIATYNDNDDVRAWRIRNVIPAKPSTPSNEELTQRMEVTPETLQGLIDLVHEVVAFFPGTYRNEHPVYVARALQLDLPKPVDPIDPDLALAREIVLRDITEGEVSDEYKARVPSGAYDDWPTVIAARFGIKAGRTLAAGGTAHE